MSAQIIDFAAVRASRSSPAGSQSAPTAPALETNPVFQFWSGASGNRYVHSIYNLFECPPLPAGNYCLVRRNPDGGRTVLSIGRTANESASNNLAAIRQRSALVGANEVHVHLLAGSETQSALIEADLQSLVVHA